MYLRAQERTRDSLSWTQTGAADRRFPCRCCFLNEMYALVIVWYEISPLMGSLRTQHDEFLSLSRTFTVSMLESPQSN